MDDVRVVIVADDPLVRSGLAALLADRPGCRVAGQAAPDDLPEALAVYRADVVVWDLGWDPADVPDGLADLAADGPPSVALLADEALASVVRGAGVLGLLQRHTDGERLLVAIQAVSHGLAVSDPALSGPLPITAGPPDELLTPREIEVLRLLAEGLANKAIALQLGISEHTVKFHLNAILGKLGAQSRTEAVVTAIRLGLIAV